MSKSIEQILAPKPEARLPVPRRQTGPRIYAYSIGDKARGLHVRLTSADDADGRRFLEYRKFHLRKSAQSADHNTMVKSLK